MDAQERVEGFVKSWISPVRNHTEATEGLSSIVRQADQAAREKALEEAAVWHDEQAGKFTGDEGDPASRKEMARRAHVVSRDHFRALAEEVT